MKLNVDELSDEEIEAVLNSAAFQKAAQYRRLAQGIEVLKQNDAIYHQLVSTIVARHSSVSTTASIEEALDLLVEEVETYTADLSIPNEEDLDENGKLSDLYVDDGEDDER